MSAPLVVHVRVRLTTGLNDREHHFERKRRVGGEHDAIGWHLVAARRDPPPLPAKVTLVRWGPKPLDKDNVAGALKGAVDSVARYLRLRPGPGGRPDDTDPRVRWREFGALGPEGLTICIEPWPDGPVDDGLDRLEVVAEQRPGALAAAFPNCTYLTARK
jgi:hypothetical protein